MNLALAPVLLLIHGGGFLGGTAVGPDAEHAARAAGMQPHEVHYPLGRIARARRYTERLAAHVSDGGRRQVLAYGESAGGTLALDLARRGFASRAVAVCPPVDLVHTGKIVHWEEAAGADPGWPKVIPSLGSRRQLHKASPLFHLLPPGARALVQVCDDDPVVPSDEEYDYADRDPRVSAMTFQSVHIYTPPASRVRQVSDAVAFLSRGVAER